MSNRDENSLTGSSISSAAGEGKKELTQQNPYMSSFYKGKEELLLRSKIKAQNLKESGLDKLEDFSYLGQKKYFETQLGIAKKMALFYTFGTFFAGGLVWYGVKSFPRVPRTMAFGAGFLATASLWISF